MLEKIGISYYEGFFLLQKKGNFPDNNRQLSILFTESGQLF